MNVLEILQNLSSFDNDDLIELNKAIVDLVKHRRQHQSLQFARVQAMSWTRGQKVQFDSRQGKTITAIIDKINQKTASVTMIDPASGVRNVPPQQWRVPFGMLRRAA